MHSTYNTFSIKKNFLRVALLSIATTYTLASAQNTPILVNIHIVGEIIGETCVIEGINQTVKIDIASAQQVRGRRGVAFFKLKPENCTSNSFDNIKFTFDSDDGYILKPKSTSNMAQGVGFTLGGYFSSSSQNDGPKNIESDTIYDLKSTDFALNGGYLDLHVGYVELTPNNMITAGPIEATVNVDIKYK